MVSLFDILYLDSSERGDKVNERLKAIRKKLSLSQEAFGKKLGVTGTAISRMEIGNRAVTEQMILAICREFNVREEWLRNGSGEMFLDFTEDEFAKSATALTSDAFVRSLLIEYCKLDEDSKQLFREFIHKLSDNMRSQNIPTHEKPAETAITKDEAETEYIKSRSNFAQKTKSSALSTTEDTEIENGDFASNQ